MPLTRDLKLPDHIHPHSIQLCTTVGQNSPRGTVKKIEFMTEEEKEEAMWQCNGSDMFRDGCKSG